VDCLDLPYFCLKTFWPHVCFIRQQTRTEAEIKPLGEKMKSRLLSSLILLFLALPVVAQEFGSISGTVTAGDRALEGAIITAFALDDPNGGNHGRPQVTETNARGEYAFDHVYAGRVLVQAVVRNGGEPQSQQGEVAGEHNLVINFNFHVENHDEVGIVHGVVISGNEPVAGAVVTLVPADNNGNRVYSAQTQRDGTYRIENVEAGFYLAQAQGPFGGMAHQQIEVIAGEDLEVNFAIAGGNGEAEVVGGVSGIISDPDGNPIARAEVIVVAMIEGGDPNGGRHHQVNLMTHTDAEGHYAIDNIPVGVQAIAAGCIGYIPVHGEVEIIEEEVTEFNIVLEPFDDEDLVFGSVSGTVTSEAGEVLAEAHVLLVPRVDRGENEWPHDPNHGREQLVTFTDVNGNYNFAEVQVGDYLARAAKRGFVNADLEISVVEGENTEANFALAVHEGGNGGNNGGGEGRHDGEPVELQGIAIVIEGDVADIYLLDTDADGAADVLLNFGPPEYEPDNGATRPASGDEVQITGVIVGHMEPPMVLVLSINGQVWRNADGEDHGGRPGGGNGWNGDEELELVEAEGSVIVNANGPWYHHWFLNIDDTERAEFVLFFGEDDYQPDNGLERPADGDFVSIIGGLYRPREGLPVIVVYQLNGQLWREPGDTMQLYWQEPDAVKEINVSLPSSALLIETYPNPFNPKASVSVNIPEASKVRVSLVDLTGRELALIAEGNMEAGRHNFTLDGMNMRAGTYFLRLETPAGGVVQRVTLVK